MTPTEQVTGGKELTTTTTVNTQQTLVIEMVLSHENGKKLERPMDLWHDVYAP